MTLSSAPQQRTMPYFEQIKGPLVLAPKTSATRSISSAQLASAIADQSWPPKIRERTKTEAMSVEDILVAHTDYLG